MKHVAAMFLFLAPYVVADTDPFECVDPDVANAFLGNWHQDTPTFSTTLPADFDFLRLPEEFVLIGSQSSASYTSVVYRSASDAATALSRSVEAMEEDGWTSMEQGSRRGFGGFQPQARPVATHVCRDGLPGVMTVMSGERSGQTLTSFVISEQNRGRTCADMNRERPDVPYRLPLQRHMPKLTLPDDAEATDMGMGGTGDEMSSRVALRTSRSREDLLALLGEQLRNQSWRYDSGWSGSVSSGTIWLTSGDEGREVLGVLRVTEVSDGEFNVRFSVSPVAVDERMMSLGTFSSSAS